MDEKDALGMLLRSRGLLYAVLSRCFADAPDKALLETLSSLEFGQICSVLDSEGGELSEMQAAVGAEASMLGLEECAREYAVCFMGLDTLVSPWESVYETGEKLIFQPCTLEVRGAYRSEGFEASMKGHEPDDHIATELDFMAKLAERASEEFGNGECEAASATLSASRRFLVEHLGTWVGGFADALESTGSDGAVYWRIARFAVAFIGNDEALLEELTGVLA